MHHILSIHLSSSRQLGCFHFLTPRDVNNVINMNAQISFGVPAFNSLEYIPRVGISGLHRNSVLKLKYSLKVFDSSFPSWTLFLIYGFKEWKRKLREHLHGRKTQAKGKQTSAS